MRLDVITIIIIVISVAGVGAIALGVIGKKKGSHKKAGAVNKVRTDGSAILEREKKAKGA
ncbi:MAG: hypothetical protein JW839_10845 [Candidatus Lokiarchaeota archaeon]|nr:hypothetical protein [Candidatus Lokiarchaeota archaeon]